MNHKIKEIFTLMPGILTVAIVAGMLNFNTPYADLDQKQVDALNKELTAAAAEAGNTSSAVRKPKINRSASSSAKKAGGTGISTVSTGGSAKIVHKAKLKKNQKYKDGTYTGSGAGFNGGTTTVRVTIKKGKIKSIAVISNGDTPSYFSRARVLLSRMVKQQSTNVDAVSGATFSSRGIITATENALEKAVTKSSKKSKKAKKTGCKCGKKNCNCDKHCTCDDNGGNGKKPNNPSKPDDPVTPVDPINPDNPTNPDNPSDPGNDQPYEPKTYKNGTFTGSNKVASYGYNMYVEVTIKDDKIVSIKTTNDSTSSSNDDYIEMAKTLIAKILNIQSAEDKYVDKVTGATYSSNALKRAVRKALSASKAALAADKAAS